MHPMTVAEYRRRLDPYVRPEAFRAHPGVLLHALVHLAIVISCNLWVARHPAALPWSLGLALVAGHSVGILAFAGHEILHGAVVRRPWARYPLALVAWTFSIFATPLMQQRAHNAEHHRYTNTERDPDRRIYLHELGSDPSMRRLLPWLFPNRLHPVASPILGFALAVFTYHSQLLFHSLRRVGGRYDMRLSDRQRLQASLEFAWNVSAQLLFWAASGFHPVMPLYLVLVYYVATTLDSLYIATNHLMSGLADGPCDQVLQTVSLRVPAWMDFIHLGFSHHTEHHLYPNAGPRYYPRIRAALRTEFPDRYRELTMPAALRLLLTCPAVALDANTLVHPDGLGAMPVPFPVPQAAVRRAEPAVGV